MCVYMSCLHVYVHHVYSAHGIESLGTGVMCGHELLSGCWEPNSCFHVVMYRVCTIVQPTLPL